jgi:hypothetical protein
MHQCEHQPLRAGLLSRAAARRAGRAALRWMMRRAGASGDGLIGAVRLRLGLDAGGVDAGGAVVGALTHRGLPALETLQSTSLR